MTTQLVLVAASSVLAISSIALALGTRRLRRHETAGMQASGLYATSSVLVALVSVLATTAASLFAFGQQLPQRDQISNPSSGTTSVTIVEPSSGEVVPADGFPVFGTVKRLPDSSFIWAVSRGDGLSDTYQPLDRPCTIITSTDSGPTEFNCGIFYVGGAADSGKSFMLFALIVDSAAAQEFLRYNASDPAAQGYPGLSNLPAGAQVAATVTVTRGASA